MACALYSIADVVHDSIIFSMFRDDNWISAWKRFQHLLCVLWICLKPKLLYCMCVKKFFYFRNFPSIHFFSASFVCSRCRYCCCIVCTADLPVCHNNLMLCTTLFPILVLGASSHSVVNRKFHELKNIVKTNEYRTNKQKNVCTQRKRNWKFLLLLFFFYFSSRFFALFFFKSKKELTSADMLLNVKVFFLRFLFTTILWDFHCVKNTSNHPFNFFFWFLPVFTQFDHFFFFTFLHIVLCVYI